jgi:hypothetical protein
MSHQDLYRELSKKVGTEHSQIVPEIWKTVCTPEEATLLNVLPATMEELAQRFGKSQEASSVIYPETPSINDLRNESLSDKEEIDS